MTGYQSKRAMAQDKLNDDDDDTQVYKDHGDALTIAYQSGYYDGKKAALIREALAQPEQEPQVCCGEYDTCLRACTPRGRHLAQLEQEPVAWAHKEGLESIKDFDASIYANGGFDDAVPLYTTPQRTWVGLTDEQIDSFSLDYSLPYSTHSFARAIEAYLKEKNT